VRTWIAAAVNSVVEDAFRDRVGDETYERYLAAGDSLVAMLDDMEVESVLTLEQLDDTPSRGRTLWKRFAISSPVFCATQVVGCERREIQVAGIDGLDARADMDVTWTREGGLDLEPYVLAVDFYTMMRLIIAQTLLPAIPRDVDEIWPVDLMADLVDCEGITARVVTFIADRFFDISPAAQTFINTWIAPGVNTYCELALENWGSAAQAQLKSLDERESTLSLDDVGTLSHPARSGLFDAITGGTSRAQWTFLEDPDIEYHGPLFNGTFTGEIQREQD